MLPGKTGIRMPVYPWKPAMKRWINQFINNRSGNFAVMAAVMALPLVTAIGAAVDYASMARIRSNLQQATDAAALAGANELKLAGASESTVNSVATDLVVANASHDTRDNVSVGTAILDESNGVTVTASYVWQPIILHHISSSVMPIETSATAQISGSANICVLGLAAEEQRTVALDNTATITGNNCGVYSNSSHSRAIQADADSQIVASVICAVGGASGTPSAFTPNAVSDCPAIPDPLAGRAEPGVGSCDHNNTQITDQNIILNPGVYCGGIKIDGESNVVFNPGVYTIKGNRLIVLGNSTITGVNVGFYLADDPATFEFKDETTIELTAPVDGPLAGILVFDSRDVVDGRRHMINSNNAKILIGTFYLPASTLRINTVAPVAAESAFTAIIAHKVELLENPNLVLNADYGSTDIPVPEGLVGNQVVLVR